MGLLGLHQLVAFAKVSHFLAASRAWGHEYLMAQTVK
jgi:hypothetical protein